MERFFKFRVVRPVLFFALFLFVATLFFLMGRASFKVRHTITQAVARILHGISKKNRMKVQKNISLIRPDLNQEQIEAGSRKVAETLARSWAAMFGNSGTRAEENNAEMPVEVDGLAPLLEAYAAQKKIVITAAHIGPIEALFHIVPRFNLRLYIPAEPVKPDWLFRFMNGSRASLGDIVLEPVQRGRTLDKAREHLEQGRIVVLTVDVTTRSSSGVVCRIGNGCARFPVGAVKLALEENALLFPLLFRYHNGGIQLNASPPFSLMRSGDHQKDIEENTRALIERVYAPYLQQHYAQWLRLLWIDFVTHESLARDTSPLFSPYPEPGKDFLLRAVLMDGIAQYRKIFASFYRKLVW